MKKLEKRAKTFDVRKYWVNHDRDLHVMFPAQTAEVPDRAESGPPIPKGGMHNRYEGLASAWQSHETVDDFLSRLPVLKSSWVGPWLWVANPYADRDAEPESRNVNFMQEAPRLLSDYLELRRQTTEDNPGTVPGVITRKLKPARDKLKQDILSLAKRAGMTSGKWMLFPSEQSAPGVWKRVVTAVIEGKLGVGAKIATDDGGKGSRLICLYTKDFSDEADVKRVVQQMEKSNLLPGEGRSVYYKCDAYTHLDIASQNEYGLQASLYASKDMLEGPAPKPSTATKDKNQKRMADFATESKAAGKKRKT